MVASAHQPAPSQVLGSTVWDAWVTATVGSRSRGGGLRRFACSRAEVLLLGRDHSSPTKPSLASEGASAAVPALAAAAEPHGSPLALGACGPAAAGGRGCPPLVFAASPSCVWWLFRGEEAAQKAVNQCSREGPLKPRQGICEPPPWVCWHKKCLCA